MQIALRSARKIVQELQRRDSVIARIEGSHMDRTELALQSLLQDSHPPGAASWQDSALQDEPGKRPVHPKQPTALRHVFDWGFHLRTILFGYVP